MAWEARSGLKHVQIGLRQNSSHGLNGLGSPFGIETLVLGLQVLGNGLAKWPGKPVRD